LEGLEGRALLGNLVMCGSIILIWWLNEEVAKVYTGFIRLRIGFSGGAFSTL
jgi:hypothetical protein